MDRSIGQVERDDTVGKVMSVVDPRYGSGRDEKEVKKVKEEKNARDKKGSGRKGKDFTFSVNESNNGNPSGKESAAQLTRGWATCMSDICPF